MGELWQSIESAPKDGTDILICGLHDSGEWMIGIGYWDQDLYTKKPRPFWKYHLRALTDSRNTQPLYWQPIEYPRHAE